MTTDRGQARLSILATALAVLCLGSAVWVASFSVGHRGRELAGPGDDLPGLFAVELYFGHGFGEVDGGPQPLRSLRHALRNHTASTRGMEYTVLVFKKGQDGEYTGTGKRGHAQILALKGARQSEAFVLKEGLQVPLDALSWSEIRQQRQEFRIRKTQRRGKGFLQYRDEGGEFSAVVIHETRKTAGINRR